MRAAASGGSSPRRCAAPKHTAALIAREIGVEKIETEPRLIEQDYGIYENTDWDGEAFNRNKRQFAVRYPGGESMLDLAGRLYPMLDELKAQGGEPTLLVCHGGICRMIRTYFLDVPNEDYAAFKMANCGGLEFDLQTHPEGRHPPCSTF